MSVTAAMSVQGEQEGAEHAAWGGSSVELSSGGSVTASQTCLGSVCELQSVVLKPRVP